MHLTIPVAPTGQQRPRFTARGKFGRAYKSTSQKQHERDLRFYVDRQAPETPMAGPLDVTIEAYLPIPKSWPKWKRAAALSGEIRPLVVPDVDNMAKNILDVSNGVLFGDDKQIVGLMIRKFYSSDPRWEYGIKEAV